MGLRDLLNPGSWEWARVLSKSLTIQPAIKEFDHGASAGGDHARGPTYPAINSMSAMVAFADLHSSVVRRARDFATVPIRIYDKDPTRDPSAKVLTGHPLGDLLARPNEDDTAVEWMRQIMTDLQPSGNSYQAIVSSTPGGPPTSLVRLHPEEVRIIPQRMGRWRRAYQHDTGDGVRNYSPDQVIHFRYESSEKGPAGMYGDGIVRSLNRDLETLDSARRGRNKMAKTGRPDVSISPKGANERWNEKSRQSVLDSYADQQSDGGPLVLSGNSDVNFLNHTPREMDWRGLEQDTRRRILSAAHVPPVVAGEEGANFATAQNQVRLYWMGLKMDGALLSARLTHSLGHRFGKPVWVWMDFSAIPALRQERGSQIDRATSHIANGADRQDAYEAEGLPGHLMPEGPAPQFEEEPEEEEPEEDPAEDPDDDLDEDDPLEELDSDDRKDAAYIRAVRATPASRSRWDRWLVKSHKPAERRLKEAIRRYLSEASARYARRVAAGLSKAYKGLSVADWDREIDRPGSLTLKAVHLEEILDLAGELVAMEAAVAPAWVKSWRLAGEAAVAGLGLDAAAITFDPARPEVVRDLRNLLVRVTSTTADAVRVIVQDGLEQGASIGAIQEAIHTSRALGASRALTIARTEATVAVNSGTLAAYTEAENKGVDVRKVWRTASDGVRESHQTMDDQERNTSEEFESGEGNTALHPGGFGVAEEDINCRCGMEARIAGGGQTTL